MQIAEIEDHVAEVLDTWKKPFQGEVSELKAYQYSEQLKKMAGLFSPGPQYYYILDLPNLNMEFISESVEEVLGVSAKQASIEMFIERLVPQQKEAMIKKEAVVIDFFCNHLPAEDILSYKSVYLCNVRDVNDKPHTILHQATPLTLTSSQRPKHILVVHTDVSHLVVQHKGPLNFICLDKGKSFYDVPFEQGVFDPHADNEAKPHLLDVFSKREMEVIRRISEGLNTNEIAEKMHISVHTLRTHRRNMLIKSKCKNIHELLAQCLMAGLI